jgi:arsenate reductase
MNRVFTLYTCDTSRRILAKLDLEGFEIIDIKKHGIEPEQLEEMKALAGSYQSLFSRRSRSYAKQGLKNKVLSESDYRQLILSDYTFLKRPVIVLSDKIYIGNQKKNVELLIKNLGK